MNTLKHLKPKHRILETALDLFYMQGYLATGINQIIQEASVSKASFYTHFKSKEDLCIAYLQLRHTRWSQWLENKINQFDSPLDRFMAPLLFLKEWLPKSDFRGCAFLNIASEITESDSGVRQEVIAAKSALRNVLVELTTDLQTQHSKINVNFVANSYYLLFEGTISACQVYSDVWPIEQAYTTMKALVEL